MIAAALLLLALVTQPPPRPPLPLVLCGEPGGPGIPTEVLRPPAGANGAAIVYVHGGNWFDDEGLKQQFGLDDPVSAESRAELRRLADRGYVIFVPHYRGSPRFKFPTHIIDLKCAMRAVRARASELGIDADRIGVMGASAGGHLAALLGLAGPPAGWDVGPYPSVSSRPQAVADLSGPSDLSGPIPPLAIPLALSVFGSAETGAPVLRSASPIAYVSGDAPPFLIVHGESDPIVPSQLSQRLYERLRQAGADASFLLVRHAGHELKPIAGYSETDPPASELSARLLAFFDRTLGSRTTSSGGIDAAALLRDLDALASDQMQGRRPGTAGHDRARDYIVNRFRQSGLEKVAIQPFTFRSRREPTRDQQGANIVGMVRGNAEADRAIVITAHYDHLGVLNGNVFNGADDNASGTAALFALAAAFAANPPHHTLIFAALDAEELGLHGARAFLEKPPVPLESIVLDVNLDMIGRDANNTLYAAGTSHYPFLRPILERVAANAPVKLLLGHDGPGAPAIEDWTRESDHYAFHERGIPFIYFGVEDEAQHHKATDDPATMTRPFYVHAVETILAAVRELDEKGDALFRSRVEE